MASDSTNDILNPQRSTASIATQVAIGIAFALILCFLLQYIVKITP